MMGAGSKYRPRSRRTVVGKLVLCLVAGVGCVSASVLSAQVAGAATDTVTNCSGSASDSGSLPYEVVNASSGDTISFSVTCPSNSPITLSSTIDISTNLTINGPGASSLVVSGNNAVEVFDVNASGVTVTISGLTIEDGSASNGGGIQNSGTLELTESDISSNIAGVGGGGINNNGTLDVTDTTVFGNSAGYGGGIWSDNTLSLANSNISDNSATSVVGAGGQGGGIENGGSLNITDSTLSGNSGALGGGIDSGASNGQISTISNSTLSGNSSDYGGGILSRGINGSTFDVSNSTVADNHASFLGGGIDDVHTLTVTNSTLSGNGAPAGGGIEFSGGSTATIVATMVANSSSGGDCTISGTLIDGGYNLDDDGTCGFSASNDFSDTPADLDPAGLQRNGGPTQTVALQPGSPAVGAVTDASLCSTPDQRGVARPRPCDIGAYQSGTDIVTNCSGSASDRGSLPYEVANASSDDTIIFSVTCPASSPITLSSTIDIDTNLTINGPGVSSLAVSGNNAVEVMEVASGVTASLSGITIEDGYGDNQNPVSYDPELSGQGGGIDNNGTLTITDSTLLDNSATSAGALRSGGPTTVIDSTLSGNTATVYGGGAIMGSSPLTVIDSTFLDNSAANYGGAIANEEGLVSVSNSTFDGNSAGAGGGIYNYIGTSTVTNSTLANNTAGFGGGIFNVQGNVDTAATIVADSDSGGDCQGQGGDPGTFVDNGYNLDDDGSCRFTSSTSFSDTPASLDPRGIQSNGGPTQTIALEPGSPAAGGVTDSSLCSMPDQRGVARPTPCDLGASEQLTQTVSFSSIPPGSAYVGSPTYATSASSSSGLPVVLTIDSSASSVCSINGGTVMFSGVGTCTINANQAGNTDFTTAPQVQQMISVSQGMPTISWSSPSPITYGTPLSATQLDATASVPGTFSYSPPVGQVLPAGSQDLSVTFTPTDTTDYTSTTSSVTLLVNQATPSTPTISDLPASGTYGGGFTAAVATSGDGTTSITSSSTGVCTVSGFDVTYVGVGTCTLAAHVAAGTDYTAADGTGQSFSVNPATPTITWTQPSAIYTDTPLSATQLDAQASVPGTFSYTPSAGTALEAGTNTLHVIFTPTDSVDYTTATGSTTITVKPPVITSPASTVFVKGHRGSLSVTSLGITAPSFTETGALPVGVTLSKAGVLAGTPTATGSFPITIMATNGRVTATQSFKLQVASIYITTTALPSAKIGVPYSAQLAELGGVAPFTWANTSPKLPAGLVLNPATGKITGTVKATVSPGPYSVFFTIADSAHPTHHTWSKTLTITVTD